MQELIEQTRQGNYGDYHEYQQNPNHVVRYISVAVGGERGVDTVRLHHADYFGACPDGHSKQGGTTGYPKVLGRNIYGTA